MSCDADRTWSHTANWLCSTSGYTGGIPLSLQSLMYCLGEFFAKQNAKNFPAEDKLAAFAPNFTSLAFDSRPHAKFSAGRGVSAQELLASSVFQPVAKMLLATC